jgi:hypothetical protein
MRLRDAGENQPMTKPLPFTESRGRRTIAAVRKEVVCVLRLALVHVLVPR